jgi:nucleotide-binding universal stress UspA family protein
VSEERQRLAIRRILVALDASPHSLAALEAAVALAARFHAELAGLFVEDADLLRLAELPFAEEIGLFSAQRRRLDGLELERQMRAQMVRIRRLFAGATQQAHVEGSFRVARGAVTREVLSAAAEADVLILGRAGWSLVRGRQLGSTTRGVLTRTSGLALILHAGTCVGPPVVVAYDGSPATRKALDAAAAMAEEEGGGFLTVLLVAEGEEEIESLRDSAAARLAERELDISYRSLPEASVSALVRLTADEACGLLVLPARTPVLQHDKLMALLDRIQVPVLLVG